MAIRHRHSGWQADVQWRGKRAREQFDTEEAAVKWEAAARAALKAGKPVPEVRAKSGSAFETIESMLGVIIATEWGNKRGCHHSITYAKMFVAYVGPLLTPAAALTQENIDGFIAEVAQERSLGGSTVNRYLSAVGKLVKKALAAGLIPRKLEMPWQREGEARLRWYSDEEEALIRQTLLLWSRPDYHDFFVCLVDTGARPWSELARLKWADVSARPRMITFWDTKNGDSRAVPLTTRAWEAIQRQRDSQKHHGQQAGPFTDLNKDEASRLYARLRAHLPQLEDTIWYTARHTFASRLVQRSVDLYRVQKLMGHRGIEMTMRYAKLAPTHLIEAINVLEQPAGPRLAVSND